MSAAFAIFLACGVPFIIYLAGIFTGIVLVAIKQRGQPGERRAAVPRTERTTALWEPKQTL